MAACGSDDPAAEGDDQGGDTASEEPADEGTTEEPDEAGGDDTGDMGPGVEELTYLGQTENTTIVTTLETLAAEECADVAGVAPLSPDATPGASFDQQIQLLAGQDALPAIFMASGTPSLMSQFIEAGQIQNLDPILEEQGVAERIQPAARSTIQSLYGTPDGMYAIPTEFNIEGFWFNQDIFEERGVEVPTTWTEFVDVSRTLKDAGVQPLTTPGVDGWNITRLVGGYIFRDLGPDALKAVADGEASLTDPEYLAAAEAVAELGEFEAYGPGVGSIDYNTALNQFLTGEAAMIYMGSWALGNWNDPEQNQIGEDAIGFFKFPAVEGGAGNIDQIPANVGVPVSMASNGFGQTNADWLGCIAENYGDTVLNDSGVISGFVVDNPPSDLPPLTQRVQELINEAEESVLWFEALFTPEGTSTSQQNASALITGQLSPEEFMQQVQSANEG